MRNIFLSAAVLFLVSSCSLYRSAVKTEPTDSNLLGEHYELPDSSASVTSWRTMFRDENLQLLIERAIKQNSDLELSRLNIEQAEAALMSARLSYLPSLSLTPDGTVTKIDNVPMVKSYKLPLAAQWELDFFGRIRNSKKQAAEALMSSKEYTNMVQAQLVSAVANSYYTLLSLKEQLAITNSWYVNQGEYLESMRAMKEAGMVTEAAVNATEASYHALKVSAIELSKQVRLLEANISLILNETPNEIICSSYADSEIDNMNMLEEGVSLYTLSNRPDVLVAEHNLASSYYGVNIAKSAFYPSVKLTGSGGWANNVGMVVNPATLMASLTASLTEPIFNKGALRANHKVAKSRYEQALITFQKSLLTAGNEVNAALVSYESALAKTEAHTLQLKANDKAVDNTEALMQNSSSTYLEVLTARNNALQTRMSIVSDWLERAQAQITLYRALGGGVE